jgi:hypothetical protein
MEAVGGTTDLILSAIVDGEDAMYFRIALRCLYRRLDDRLHIRGQAFDITTDKDSNPMLVVEAKLAMEFGNQHTHEVGDLLFASFPVLCGEDIEGNKPDAKHRCFFYNSLESLEAFKMACSPG